MANRKPIKQAHEQFHVSSFLDWLNRAYRTDYRVIAEPDPPEAVIQSSLQTSWIEVSTAFLNADFAQDVMSSVTPGETHRSVSGELIVGPDEQFALNFVNVVKKKLEKTTYQPFLDRYGPGYLIVPILNPFFDETTLTDMRRIWAETEIQDLGCFRSVRFTYRKGQDYMFHRWPRRGGL